MMNKENKIVPELRFPEFLVSKEWVLEPFSEIYSFVGTNSFTRDNLNYRDGDIKNIHYGDIHTKFNSHFDINKETVPFVNTDISVEKIKEESFCKESDMIFADASEDLNDIGKNIEIINSDGQKILSGLHTLLARQRTKKLHIGFGGHLFKSPAIRIQIQKEAQGSKVLGISATRLSNISVYYPENKDEQQKIASCLSSLDELINAHTQKLDAMKDHKKGLMQQLFPAEGETAPKLRFKEFENDGDWVEKSVQQLIDENVIIGHLDGNHGGLYPKAGEFASEGIPYITANDFIAGIVEFSRCKRLSNEKAKKFKKGVAKNGDILFAHNATVGPVAKLETDLQYVILSTTATYFRCDNNRLINDFLKYCLTSPNFVRQYTRIMAQSTRNQVPITAQRKLEIQMPSSNEQQKIANFLSSIDDEITAQTQKIEALKEHKKGLMQGLFPCGSSPQ